MSAVVKTLEALFAAERDLRGAHKTSKNNNHAQQRGRAATRLGAVQTARPYDEGIDGGDHHLETSDHENEGDGLEHGDGEAKKEGSQVVREGMKNSGGNGEASPPKKSYTWAASRQDVREHYLGGHEDNSDADHGNNHDIEEGLRGNLTAKKSKGKDKLAGSSYTQFDS